MKGRGGMVTEAVGEQMWGCRVCQLINRFNKDSVQTWDAKRGPPSLMRKAIRSDLRFASSQDVSPSPRPRSG